LTIPIYLHPAGNNTGSLRELVITIFSVKEYTLPVYYPYISDMGWRALEGYKAGKRNIAKIDGAVR